MNGVVGILIVGILTLGSLSIAAFNKIYNNEKRIEQVKKTKEVITAVKQSNIASQATENYIKNAEYLPNINPNVLNLKTTDFSDKTLILKLYHAMRYAVIKENIRKPTCGDLAKTGLITLKECNYIANKTGLYVDINDGVIKINSLPASQKNISEVKTFINTIRTMNGTPKKVSVVAESNTQNTNNSNTDRTKKSSVEVPVVSAVITQTINTSKRIPRKIIREKIISAKIENWNQNERIRENVAETLRISRDIRRGRREEISSEITRRQTQFARALSNLTPVSLRNNNINNPIENFRNSFMPSFLSTGRNNQNNNQREREATIRRVR